MASGFLHYRQHAGGCTTYNSGTGTCHQEGYLFSRYWYQFSQFWFKERYLFSRFFYEICRRSDILFRKIGIRSGVLFQKIGIRNGCVFEASMARPRPKSGQVHPRGQHKTLTNRSCLSCTDEAQIYVELNRCSIPQR